MLVKISRRKSYKYIWLLSTWNGTINEYFKFRWNNTQTPNRIQLKWNFCCTEQTLCVIFVRQRFRVNETKRINKECLVVIGVCHSLVQKYQSRSDKIDVLGERDNTMTSKRHYEWVFFYFCLPSASSISRCECLFVLFVYFQMGHWFCLSSSVCICESIYRFVTRN